MPPRVNAEGQYTDAGTVDHDGKLVPYTAEEIARTRAFEEANGIPSTIPDDADGDVVVEDETTDGLDPVDDA